MDYIISAQWVLLRAELCKLSRQNIHAALMISQMTYNASFGSPLHSSLNLQKYNSNPILKREKEWQNSDIIMCQHARQLRLAKDQHLHKEIVSSYSPQLIFHIIALESPRRGFVVSSFLLDVRPKVGKKKDRRSMDRRIIEKDGKWRNDHGIDTKWTIFDGKGFFVETRYDT